MKYKRRANVVLMAKQDTDGVYTDNPNVNPFAKRYKTISNSDVIANNLQVADLSLSCWQATLECPYMCLISTKLIQFSKSALEKTSVHILVKSVQPNRTEPTLILTTTPTVILRGFSLFYLLSLRGCSDFIVFSLSSNTLHSAKNSFKYPCINLVLSMAIFVPSCVFIISFNFNNFS